MSLNLFANGWAKKLAFRKLAWGVGVGLSMLLSPVFADPLVYSNVFSFDLISTAAGVVEVDIGSTPYLYGTTNPASRSVGGAIYRVSPNGGAPQTIYQLKDTEGFSPSAALMVMTDPNTATQYLYGATLYGPRIGNVTTSGAGTLFRVAVDGTGFQTLHTFADFSDTTNAINADGARPNYQLITDGTYVYGVTRQGGANGNGTVFRIKFDGTGFTVLHTFSAVSSTDGTNADGASPSASLTLANNRLYGVTSAGGAGKWKLSTVTTGTGVIFTLNTDGSDFQTIFSFNDLDSTGTTAHNVSGAVPKSPLLYASNKFYGTANVGGTPSDSSITGSYGTVFSFTTNNTANDAQVTVLHSFTAADGSGPFGVLALNSGAIYGVTAGGTNSTTAPLSAYGSVYSIDDNKVFTLQHGFTTSEVSNLTDGVILINGNFYGTGATYGSCTYYGAVYRVSPANAPATNPYANCTNTGGGGGGSMNVGWLWLLAALGLAPPVRRHVWVTLKQ